MIILQPRLLQLRPTSQPLTQMPPLQTLGPLVLRALLPEHLLNSLLILTVLNAIETSPLSMCERQ